MQILKRFSMLALGALQMFFLLAAFARPAHAYVDPGSGLLMFQIAGSMLAGALFVLRSKLRKLFRLGPAKEQLDHEVEASSIPRTDA